MPEPACGVAGPTEGLSEQERSELLRLLERHEAADAAEEAHLERIRAFASSRANPFDRGLLHGHLTCSAFVLEPAGALLLTHHRRLDLWVQVGGHADGERSAPAVALREARAESGLTDLRFHAGLLFEDGMPRLADVDLHRIPASRGEPEHDHLDLRFVLTTERPERLVANAAESKALEWVSFTEARRRCTSDLHRAITKLEALRPR